MRSWSRRTSSTRSTDASASAACSTGPIRGAPGPARSTTTTAGAACTFRIPADTIWRSSPGPTDQVPADPRRQHLDTVTVEAGEHRGPGTQDGNQLRCAAPNERTAGPGRPVDIGSDQP